MISSLNCLEIGPQNSVHHQDWLGYQKRNEGGVDFVIKAIVLGTDRSSREFIFQRPLDGMFEAEVESASKPAAYILYSSVSSA